MALARADRMPSIRQLYEIAELGKPAGEPTRTPEFLRFVVAPEQPRIPGDGLDFRDESWRRFTTAAIRRRSAR